MKIEGKEYCDVSRVYISAISKDIAKDMIVKYHYTHTWTACRYSLGVYYKSDTIDIIGNSDRLIGCIIYGFPVGAQAPTSVCEGMTKDNVLELTRLYIHDGYGSNIESYAISQSFRWLKENDENIKLLISYADNGQHHLGGIYKATNWLYQGTSDSIALMPNYGISLIGPPYKWIHSRTVFSMYGSNNLEHLKREIGKNGYTQFWRRREPAKHRYIQILAKNKKERKDLISRLKHEIKPYPTSVADYDSEIERYDTYPPEDNIKTNFW